MLNFVLMCWPSWIPSTYKSKMYKGHPMVIHAQFKHTVEAVSNRHKMLKLN